MAKHSRLPAIALALLLVAGPIGGVATAGQPAQEDGAAGANRTAQAQNATAPPGVDGGRLVNETALLDAHADRLTGAGFAANGSAALAVVRRGVLVDVTRTENRTVAANASEYRRSSTDVARTGFVRITRERDTWGNRTVEVTRTVRSGDTAFSTEKPDGDRRLSGARRLGDYLRAGEFTVTDTRTANGSLVPNETGPRADQRLFVLQSTGRANATLLQRVLPRGASNPGNFTATAVVDEAGRVRSFRARVDYTLQGERRTKRVSFTLQSLGVRDVRRPPWVDEALARSGNGTTARPPVGT